MIVIVAGNYHQGKLFAEKHHLDKKDYVIPNASTFADIRGFWEADYIFTGTWWENVLVKKGDVADAMVHHR